MLLAWVLANHFIHDFSWSHTSANVFPTWVRPKVIRCWLMVITVIYLCNKVEKLGWWWLGPGDLCTFETTLTALASAGHVNMSLCTWACWCWKWLQTVTLTFTEAWLTRFSLLVFAGKITAHESFGHYCITRSLQILLGTKQIYQIKHVESSGTQLKFDNLVQQRTGQRVMLPVQTGFESPQECVGQQQRCFARHDCNLETQTYRF